MGTTIAVGAFWAFVNYRRYKKNLIVAQELDSLIKSTLNVVTKNKELASQYEKSIFTRLYDPALPTPNVDSPVMLSTIVTVLVNKFGDVRLSMKDFMIPDEEYVSVYVDGDSRELILSMNHELTVEDSYSMANFADPDDNTFH